MELYVGDIAEFRQRVENGAISPDCNSFNAEYPKRGIIEHSEENSTGAGYGCRSYFSSGGKTRHKGVEYRFETKHQRAFTLAEILITLSIIGVVAALTIPGLIANNQEKQTIVQVKKAYNVLTNAFNLAKMDYGNPQNWGCLDNQACVVMNNYLKILKDCTVTKKGCFAESYYSLDETTSGPLFDDADNSVKLILNDGASYRIWWNRGDCGYNTGSGPFRESCGGISVDINGLRGPNKTGRDLFGFRITKSGIFPFGLPDNSQNPINLLHKEGNGAAGWILVKENMDYIRHEVSWD